MRKLLTICFFLCCCQVIVAQSNAAFKQRMQHVIEHENKSAEKILQLHQGELSDLRKN